MVSSYHAAEWQRLQELKNVYPAYRYKTREDDRVRDTHAALNNKVFNANDPIWDTIYPPNGWYCRCYVEPLADDELATIPSNNRVRLEDSQQRAALLAAANVQKEFRRNSGKSESIWGKWLQEKLQNKNYEEITNRMKEFVNAMPDADEAIKNLEANAVPYRELEFSSENILKEFPGYKVQTPLGEFEFAKKFWTKIEEGRKDLFGLVKPTMKTPDYIIIDNEYGTLFLKAYIKNGSIIYAGVIGSGSGMIISFHQKGNVMNKIKSGKLLIYESERVHGRGAGTPDSFVELPDDSGRLAFNVQHKRDSVKGERWGEFVKPGKTIVREMIYRVKGFLLRVDDEEKGLMPYSEIDEHHSKNYTQMPHMRHAHYIFIKRQKKNCLLAFSC